MKHIFFLSLLLLSSCALYKDFEETEFNWWGEQNFKRSDTKKAEESLKPSTEPTESVTTFHKEVDSTDKKAKLILDETNDVTSISIVLNEGSMSYRSGHSVDLKIDNEAIIWKVEPSENKSSPVLKFARAFELFQKIKNKKTLLVSLALDGEGTKSFEFTFPSP